MNNTTYKPRISPPYQVAQRPVYKKEVPKDIVQEEMQRLIGRYEFSAEFAVDTQTATTLKDVRGRVIAFICTLKLGDKIVGQGRGTTAINQINKFIIKNISFAFHGALVDAVAKSIKIQDMFRADSIPHPWTEVSPAIASNHKVQGEEESDIATPKQVEYLRQLIQINIEEEDERTGLEAQLGELTRSEASRMIESFRR